MIHTEDHQQDQQDHQALVNAKYCPRVAAESRTQKNTKNHVTLTFEIQWSSRGCRATCSVVHANFIKLSAAIHELSWAQRRNSDENNTVSRYCGQ